MYKKRIVIWAGTHTYNLRLRILKTEVNMPYSAIHWYVLCGCFTYMCIVSCLLWFRTIIASTIQPSRLIDMSYIKNFCKPLLGSMLSDRPLDSYFIELLECWFALNCIALNCIALNCKVALLPCYINIDPLDIWRKLQQCTLHCRSVN